MAALTMSPYFGCAAAWWHLVGVCYDDEINDRDREKSLSAN